MVKVVVNQPGFFVSIPRFGSFRSPFNLRVPESMVPLILVELLKNGISPNNIFETKIDERKSRTERDIKIESLVDLSEVLKRLEEIQSLVHQVLDKEPQVLEIITQRRDPDPVISKQPEIEEEIFIPRASEKISAIELTVKTAEKDDVSSQVESLLNLKR